MVGGQDPLGNTGQHRTKSCRQTNDFGRSSPRRSNLFKKQPFAVPAAAHGPFAISTRGFHAYSIGFLFSFPWGIAQDFQWWTVPLTIIVSYFMLGMEVVAENVEEPFGLDEDDLDLEGMCKTIEQSVDEVFDPS